MANRTTHRDERGAVLPLFAIMSVMLVAAAGLGVDTSNLVLQRSQAQHAADAAVLAIANDCALGHTTCSPGGNASTAEYFIGQNAPNATSAGPVIPNTGGQVSVTVEETVPTSLMSIVGNESSDVSASATAAWGGHPVMGDPVLPLAVPYCQWYENRPGTTTTAVTLRTDLIGRVVDTIQALPLLNTVVPTLLSVLQNVTTSCDLPDGSDAAMLRGPVWLTGITEVLGQTLDQVFPGTFATDCKMHTDDLNAIVGGTLSAAVEPSCIAKLGTSIKAGDTILLPIYKPANNLLQLGFQTQACTILLGTTTCVKIPPRLGVQIMGYAPFKVTGWNFVGNTHTDPAAAACNSILTLNLPLLPGVSVGCTGLTGHFVRTAVKDPNFTYSPDGADFGAHRAELVE